MASLLSYFEWILAWETKYHVLSVFAHNYIKESLYLTIKLHLPKDILFGLNQINLIFFFLHIDLFSLEWNKVILCLLSVRLKPVKYFSFKTQLKCHLLCEPFLGSLFMTPSRPPWSPIQTYVWPSPYSTLNSWKHTGSCWRTKISSFISLYPCI